jgi:hypothetical protein
VTSADQLAERAVERAGLDDFGGDTWREGLTILLEELDRDPGVVGFAHEYIEAGSVDALWNRLRVVDHAKRHPAVRDEEIDRPVVILGMPRTGTTVASYLLAQDPGRRSLLNWEATDSIPPATADTLRSDARCTAKLEAQRAVLPGLVAAGQGVAHWEDADGPTECIFVMAQDFKALSWEAFQPNERYSEWLMHDCDMTSAYQYHKLVLQILQSAAPGNWSLKMPSHAVFIENLLDTYPDARMIWAHRDPYKATASLCSLQLGPKSMLAGGAPDRDHIARNAVRQMREHVTRPLRAREELGADRIYDLHYAEVLRDPIGEMRRLYAWSGDDFTAEVESGMKAWLAANPQDKFGPRPYSLEEYGLTEDELVPVFEEYLAAFDIEMEG